RNPRYPYIVINDLPKIENLRRLFPDYYRDPGVGRGGSGAELIGRSATSPRSGCKSISGEPSRQSPPRQRARNAGNRRGRDRSPSPRGTRRCYGASAEDVATSSLGSNRWSATMPQPNDLSRSLVALDHNSTIVAVVELSQSSWLVGGVVPGIERQ